MNKRNWFLLLVLLLVPDRIRNRKLIVGSLVWTKKKHFFFQFQQNESKEEKKSNVS